MIGLRIEHVRDEHVARVLSETDHDRLIGGFPERLAAAAVGDRGKLLLGGGEVVPIRACRHPRVVCGDTPADSARTASTERSRPRTPSVAHRRSPAVEQTHPSRPDTYRCAAAYRAVRGRASEESQVEADEQEPNATSRALAQETAVTFGTSNKRRQTAEHGAADQHVVQMRDHEERVVDLGVQRHGGEHQPVRREDEDRKESEDPQHRRLQGDSADHMVAIQQKICVPVGIAIMMLAP